MESRHKIAFSLMAVVCLLTASCLHFPSSKRSVVKSPKAVSVEKKAGEPSMAVTVPDSSSPEVLLRPGLLLNVRVLVAGQKEVEEANKRIQNDGTLSLPLVGLVHAGGKTLPAFRDDLFRLYDSGFFVNPQVIVEFAAEQAADGLFPWGYVTVLGRVKQPGRVSIPPTKDISVSRAIQLAGGFDTSARATSIRVTREKDGKQQLFSVDLKDVGARGNAKADMVLMPNDIVYVPEEIF